MSIYILDSNFFIQAHRSSYPFDVVPSFWKKVKQLAEEGKIISIDKVKNEIYKNEDLLKLWCQNELPKSFFIDTSGFTSHYSQVVNWAHTKNHLYIPKAISDFLDADVADAWIVSYALEDKENRIIITHEVSEPNSKKSIKIPDVCIEFKLKYTNTIEMFRQLGEQF